MTVQPAEETIKIWAPGEIRTHDLCLRRAGTWVCGGLLATQQVIRSFCNHEGFSLTTFALFC